MASDRRLLLVHAHPDDETIGQGATIAKYVAEGCAVTLVTCTAGEMGEILVPELAHLAADHDDRLGEHRRAELASAMSALGVTDHRFLGGFGRFRDSGMVWHDAGHAVLGDQVRPNAFWLADLTEAADELVEILRMVRPQVVCTYDPFGGYGHPDHIQAHRVATYAVALAEVASHRPDLGPPWEVAKVYWTAQAESEIRTALRELAHGAGSSHFEVIDPDAPLPFATDDRQLSTRIDAAAHLDAKAAAMRAHRTQIIVEDRVFALSNLVAAPLLGVEYYRLAKGRLGPVDSAGLEGDLFGGL